MLFTLLLASKGEKYTRVVWSSKCLSIIRRQYKKQRMVLIKHIGIWSPKSCVIVLLLVVCRLLCHYSSAIQKLSAVDIVKKDSKACGVFGTTIWCMRFRQQLESCSDMNATDVYKHMVTRTGKDAVDMLHHEECFQLSAFSMHWLTSRSANKNPAHALYPTNNPSFYCHISSLIACSIRSKFLWISQ